MAFVPKILIADNIPVFTRQCGEFLQRAGFCVVSATTLEQARDYLKNSMLHLAILDNRLISNSDKEDFSGIRLAQASDHTIAKIIFTGFENWEVVREALGLSRQGPPPACAFVAKKEGPLVLLEHVKRAVESIDINWQLEVVWTTRDPLSIAQLWASDQTPTSLIEQSEAVIDILHRVFRHYDRVNVERVIWEERTRCALVVHATAKNKPTGSFILVLGLKDVIAEEERQFRDYGPPAAQHGCPSVISVKRNAHVGALAYSYVKSAVLDTSRTLEQILNGSEKDCAASLAYLFKETLPAWVQGRPIVDTKLRLHEGFLPKVSVQTDVVAPKRLRNTINENAPRLLAVGIRIRIHEGTLSVNVGKNTYHFPDPSELLQSSRLTLTATCNSPGNLAPSRLLLDAEGKVYLTDFKDAGPLPMVWAPVVLESAVRFDLLSATTPQQLVAVEEVLTDKNLLRPQIMNVDSAARRFVRTISTIRQLSTDSINADPEAYQLGIFYELVNRITSTDDIVTNAQLLRVGHLSIALGFVAASLLAKQKPNGAYPERQRGLKIDSRRCLVTIDGVQVHVRRRSYDLLLYLYDHLGQTCSREQLIKDVLREPFDPLDQSQGDRLNMAISRLRAIVEIDSDHPKYLFSDPMGGYFIRSNV